MLSDGMPCLNLFVNCTPLLSITPPWQVRYFKMHCVDFLRNYLLVVAAEKHSFYNMHLRFLDYYDTRTYVQLFLYSMKCIRISLCLSKAAKINLNSRG